MKPTQREAADAIAPDLERAAAIIDEILAGRIDPDTARMRLEEIAGIQTRVLLADVAAR